MVAKTRNRFSKSFSVLVGVLDTITGLGLIALPQTTLNAMGVEASAYPDSLVRFIGAFVFGTGSLYLFGSYFERTYDRRSILKEIWLVTSWIRFCVGTTTLIMILTGELPITWVTVPIADISIGAFQVFWITSGRFSTNEA